MKHLPLFFDLTGRRVAVIGEGPKADLRVQLARSAGADVLRLEAGSATVQELRGAVAVFVATEDEASDADAYRLARAAGVPVNVADRPALCDFIMPAIVDRDGVVVAISTGGGSPTLATVLRGRIEAALPERLGELARLVTTFRAQVNALIADPARRARLGAAAKKRAAEKFSASVIVERYLAFYREVCAAGSLRDGAGL